jgi:hypothetical protein
MRFGGMAKDPNEGNGFALLSASRGQGEVCG